MTSCDASWLAHPSLSILLIALGFVELSDVSDCNEGIASEVYQDSEDDCRSCRRLSLYAIMQPSISLKTAGGRNIMKHFTDEL